MDAPDISEQSAEKRVSISGSELVENYTVYIIEVKTGDHSWTIKHRYSDFHDLHEKLTAEKKIGKHLLPPKKIIGKNSKSLVEKRQKELEVYIQTLLSRFPTATPKVLSNFLNFHLYEINGIAAALAEELFNKGERLLAADKVFLLRPLQLYAVTQQLKLAKPTCANGDTKADLGHILDFTCRLKYLKIPGSNGTVGTSNIDEQSLPFDLSIFKALLQIEISNCDAGQIKGLPSLKPTLDTLSIHLSANSMKEILVPEASEFAQWVPEGVDTDCPFTAIIPTWKMLTTLDMSRNFIHCIDESVKLIRKVEFLDLSYNELSVVEHLQHLYNLVHLDLSFNKLNVLEGVHTKLGNIKTLNLAGNQLETLSGLSKLYSLVNLDLSSNKLAQLDEIKHISTLPCLEKLTLANCPMCIIPDYRTKVLAQFCDRASEVCLDGTTTTEKELDTVEVLKAIQKAKEAKVRMANNDKKVSNVSGQAAGGPQSSSSSSLVVPPSSSSPSRSHSNCSSQEKMASPEPSELDFNSQFGNKSTGKMENFELVHSSKVKFVYPSEEEISDLTTIVVERKRAQALTHSFNILLYVLVFQVHVVLGQNTQNRSLLQPKTLILTCTEGFLLDEDHISYPLPEFAKEPAQRDKYRLTDAQCMRDQDRVLIGYQTYPQALTLVFDEVPGPDLLCHLTMDHFEDSVRKGDRTQGVVGAEGDVHWCIFVPEADSRERLIPLLSRQWEALCSRVDLTG